MANYTTVDCLDCFFDSDVSCGIRCKGVASGMTSHCCPASSSIVASLPVLKDVNSKLGSEKNTKT